MSRDRAPPTAARHCSVRRTRVVLFVLALAGLLWLPAFAALGDDVPEYRLKAAFVFRFIGFTEWPATTGSSLNLCIQGADPFGKEIDGLQGKVVNGRTIAVRRTASSESLKDCQVVFVSATAIDGLNRVLDSLQGRAVLTIADSPGAMRRGVVLNMNTEQGKITFEANLQAARGAGLDLSSKLLRLATEVKQ